MEEAICYGWIDGLRRKVDEQSFAHRFSPRNEGSKWSDLNRKRLARMIQTFLDVERLSEGQIDMKREPFCMQDVVIVCVERARPLAERKRIALDVGELTAASVLQQVTVRNCPVPVRHQPATNEDVGMAVAVEIANGDT